MKRTYIIILLIFITVQVMGQQKDISIEKQQLLQHIDSLQKFKPLDDYNGNWIAELEKEFYIDTFYIEHLMSLEMNADGSTLGMTTAMYNATQAYDSLLNKYYQKLYKRFDKQDKITLRTAQRNWLKFRDSEKQLNYTLYDEQYSDGGTIHKLFVASRTLEITQRRVIELYHYLDRIWRAKE